MRVGTPIALAVLGVAALAGCAAVPAPPTAAPVPAPAPQRAAAEPQRAAAPTSPLVEHPPVEPVAPTPEAEPPVQPTPEPPTPPSSAPEAPEASPAAPPIPAPPSESAEEREMSALLADLARYPTLSAEDARREVNAVTQNLNRQRNDANRVRLAMLYTLSRTAQDDQRALQLLETVAKANSGAPGVKQLANVLQAQVSERVRVAREEQQKAAAAIQKLEALRSLERSLLRDRVRGGGGGGGGGSSGGGGG